ncbi:MAG: cytochrome c nitrite reductase small subunit [Anaerolineales bacterium]|nr:cytochrome c nitrite reductase small subunit [Anaerolineales bacterium]
MKTLSSHWPLIAGIAVLFAALGVFAWATDAPAYMAHEPATCNNCHVMDAQYEGWFHAGHQSWAACTDCHLPHDNFLSYWYEKGRSGMHDVFVFSTGTYPARIRATGHSQTIIQDNCVRCHSGTVEGIMVGAQDFERHCWDCHRSVAHGERGMSLVPYHDKEIYP